MTTPTPEFEILLATCKDMSEMFDQGLVYIGGIAVYMHCIHNETTKPMAEATHDADFYISFGDMSDLRELEEVTPNRRLNKSQIIKNGFEFDIYTERLSTLIVPYDEVMAHCVELDNIRIACIEHLLVLKLEAYRDRQNSSKGNKDARDIMRIANVAMLTKTLNYSLINPYLDDHHFELFSRLRKSPESLALAKGNAMQAKSIRKDLDSVLTSIESWDSSTSTPPKLDRER